MLGATYWPQAKGLTWWERYDRGEVREDFAHAAVLGLNTLRLHLLWEAFQPRLDRVGSPAMQMLEQTLDLAAEQGLRVVLTLFTGAVGGALYYPSWTTRSSAALDLARLQRQGRAIPRATPAQPAAKHTRQVVFEHGYRTTAVRDLYEDPLLVDAQRYLIREVVGYFASHPAAWAWELGHQNELARQPRNPETFVEWQRRLADEAREQGARRVLGAVGLRALARRASGVRPEELAEVCDLLLGVVDVPAGLRLPESPALEEALLTYGLLRELAPGSPVLVENLGLPTAASGQSGWIDDRAYGSPQRTFLAGEERQGQVLGDRLRDLHAAHAQGVILAAWGDYRPELWRLPPLDLARRERSLGLLRADGSEKPAALAVQRFAEELRAETLGRPGRRPLDLGVDLEEYRRGPGAVLQRLLKDLVQSNNPA